MRNQGKSNALKNQRFLQTLLANLPAIAFVTDTNGNLLMVEGRELSAAGLNAEELVGSNVSQFGHYLPNLEPNIHRALAGETLSSIAVAPSGNSFQVTYSPFRDAKGTVSGVIGIAQDITDRIAQERALKESEEKFRSISAAALDAIIMMDSTGRVSFWNDAAEAMFGYRREEALGQPLHDLIAPPQSGNREMLERFLATGLSPLLGRTIELTMKHKSGKEFSTELSISAFQLQDRWHAVGIVRDISERSKAEKQLRESEEKFSKTFQTSAALMAITDLKTDQFVDVNDTFSRVLGYAREEVLGRTARDLNLFVAIEKRDEARDRVAEGHSVRNFEAAVRAKWGALRHGIFTAEPISLGERKCTLTVMADITERKNVEEALRASEDAYRTIFGNTGNATVIIEADTIISLVNTEFERLTGYSREEVEGKLSWTEFVVPEDLEVMTTRHHLRRQDAGSVPKRYEFRLRDKQGNLKHVLLSVDMIPGTAKSVASLTDITDRKRMEEALRSSENTYRAIFENTGSATMIVEADTTISLVNSEFVKATGYSREEVEGKMSWTQFVGEQDLRRMLEQHHLRREDPDAALRSYEFQLYGKDGIARDVLMSVDLIPGTTQSVASCLDITDRKRAEQNLSESERNSRSIVESAPWGMHFYQLESNGSLTFQGANPAADSILGIDHSQLVGMPIEQAFPDLAAAEIPDQYRRVAQEGGTWQKEHVQYEDRRIHGAYVVNAFQISPGRLAATFLDITESKRAQEERERLHLQLQQSQKLEALGTMAGGIAHDFNNILTGIIGFTELVRSEASEGTETYENLTEVVRAGRRARDLVKQILSFSRMGETEKAPISLSTIVKEALRLIRSATPSNIEIRQRSSASPSSTIMADPTQMHQVVMNLCINAADAMPDGGILEVSLEETQMTEESLRSGLNLQPGRYLRLTLQDSGMGIPPEIAERIFEPYFTTKEVGKGTGMGLAVVHGVIKDHGGAIAVSSQPKEGSTFEVYLPVIDAAAVMPTSPSTAIATGTESILFVDDETMITNLQKSQLSKWGYRVTATDNSAVALEVFCSEPKKFDLVITDQTMPGMTGVKLAQAIHEVSPHTPIILCTGFEEGVSRESAASMGIKAILTKPITGAEFSRTIRMVLDDARSLANL